MTLGRMRFCGSARSHLSPFRALQTNPSIASTQVALDAIIFDVDGTLVDSNAQQVEGWRRALEARGHKIEADRIYTEVGKGGDTLVPDLLGKLADEKDGDPLREAQPKEFEKLARA